MPNKNYIAGRRFEYKIKKLYEKQGYTVLRSSGSHGFADLIAVRQDKFIYRDAIMYKARIIFIQCKNRRPTQKEISDLQRFSWLFQSTKDWLIEVKIVSPDKEVIV